jgi:cysteine-rich secretory family protein
VDLINAHRAQTGLEPLAVSPTLTAAATWKARHMAAYGYLAHDDPGAPVPRSAGDRVAACGYPQATWGENIATGYTTAQAVVDAWLASPGHRANIERADFVATGVAMAGTQQTYWAESFGNVADGAASAVSTTPTQHSAASLTPAARASSTGRTVRVSCEKRGQRIACHVRNGRGATVRIAIRRAGHTFARTVKQVRSDDLRVHLHAMRRLHSGRYDLVVRASAPAGTRERRLTFVV